MKPTRISNDHHCPACGQFSLAERAASRPLPGDLSMPEFEVLVRGEWRRRLGPTAYGRAHSLDLIHRIAGAIASGGDEAEVTAALEPVVAELRGVGAGRREIWHEVAVLCRAVRSVLRRSGVSAHEADRRIRPLRSQLFDALGFRLPTERIQGGVLP